MKTVIKIVCFLVLINLASSSFAAQTYVKKTKAKSLKKEQTKKNVAQIKPAVQTMDYTAEIKALNERLDKAEKKNDDLKVSGEVFFQYQKGVLNSTINNGFDITRAYVNLNKNLDAGASIKLTLDAARLDQTIDPAGKSQQLNEFLKYAYFELPVGIPATFMNLSSTLRLRAGLQPTVWISWVDKIWAHRYIAKTFTDNEGLFSSSDFGIGAMGSFIFPYGSKSVEYHATFTNGTGYKKPEDNSAKDIALRLNSDIMDIENVGTVTVGALFSMKDQFAIAAMNTKQAGMLVALQNKKSGKAYIEYIRGTNVNGYSVGGFVYPVPDLAKGFSLIARADNYDPNMGIANDEIKRLIAGAAYDWGKNIQLAFDIQDKTVGNGITEHMAYLHSIATF